MMKSPIFQSIGAAMLGCALLGTSITPAAAVEPPAKRLFGSKKVGAALPAAVYGSYAKGCLSGGEKLADDGPDWQAMRLSRNRHWAHPELIALVKQLSRDGKKVGWNGLLVGDLTQPRRTDAERSCLTSSRARCRYLADTYA